MEWDLEYIELSAAELASLEDLFLYCRGRQKTFLFLDPMANLMGDSEDLRSLRWSVGPYLDVVGGASDPFGTTRAWLVTNSGSASADVTQTIPAPSSLAYCYSVYLRGDGGSAVLRASAGAVSVSREVRLQPDWNRFSLQASLGPGSENVTFGLEVSAATSVSLFGPQVDAQPQASAYMPSWGPGAIYPNARFRTDTFSAIATGPDQYSVQIQIDSPQA